MKKILTLVCALAIACVALAGCGSSASSSASASAGNIGLANGTYTAKFDTDSTMFHANEITEGVCTVTVKDGQATIHVPLAGTGYTKYFLGTAEEAQKSGAKVVEGAEEKIKYPDGLTDTVIAFDFPVPVIGEEYDLAVYGPKKDKWYDHKVSVSDPQPVK